MSMRTTVTGLDQLAGGLGDRFRKTLQAVAGAIYIEAEQVISLAKRETPVDEGVLINSGHVRLPTITPVEIEVQLGFGGPAGSGNQGGSNDEDVGYATHVHENMTARHTVGKAKYLEDPVKARQAGMTGRVSRRVKKAVEG